MWRRSKVRHFHAHTHSFWWTRQRFKPPRYHHDLRWENNIDKRKRSISANNTHTIQGDFHIVYKPHYSNYAYWLAEKPHATISAHQVTLFCPHVFSVGCIFMLYVLIGTFQSLVLPWLVNIIFMVLVFMRTSLKTEPLQIAVVPLTFLILAIISSCNSSNHFSTCPLAFDVEITSFSGTTSPSELFIWVISSVSVNSREAIPSKHFLRWGWTLQYKTQWQQIRLSPIKFNDKKSSF